jgi:rubrerythrin
MITDEERHEIAARLRKTLYKPGSLGDWWMRVHEAVTGSENSLCPQEDVAVIADLIDCPTCRIVKSAKIYTAFGELIDTMNVYVLSCGHQAVGFNRPDYCPKCGTRVER